MKAQELQSKLETLAPGTKAIVTDMTGTEDHWQAVIISPAFEGKIMIEQHRLVMSIVDAEIQSNEVHALTLKTYTPEQYKKYSK